MRFILWLRSSGLEEAVAKELKRHNCDLHDEVVNLNYSVPLAEALLSVEPKYGTVANVQEALRTGYLALSARRLDARTACDWGLVDHLVTPAAQAMASQA